MRRVGLSLALAAAMVAVGCSSGGQNAGTSGQKQLGTPGQNLYIAVSPPVGARVVSTPAAIDCGTDSVGTGSACTAYFGATNPGLANAAVSVSFAVTTQTPRYVGPVTWGGSCSGTGPCTVAVTGNPPTAGSWSDVTLAAVPLDTTLPLPGGAWGRGQLQGTFVYSDGALDANNNPTAKPVAGIAATIYQVADSCVAASGCPTISANLGGNLTALGAISVVVPSGKYYFNIAGVTAVNLPFLNPVTVPNGGMAFPMPVVDVSGKLGVASPAAAAFRARLAADVPDLAGFNKPVALTCSVAAGGTGPFTYQIQQTSGFDVCGTSGALVVSTAPVNCASAATTTITTPAYGKLVGLPALNGFKVRGVENRPGTMPITYQNITDAQLGFKCTVTDSTSAKASGTLTVRPIGQNYNQAGDRLNVTIVSGGTNTATFVQNFPMVLVGSAVVLNDTWCATWADEEWLSCKALVPSFGWSLTAQPAGCIATVNDATTQFAWFKPCAEGQYVATNSVSGATVTVNASANYIGNYGEVTANPDGTVTIANRTINGVETCAQCHDGSNPTAPRNIFLRWNGSKHAQIFADAMKEGTHYSQTCLGCHTEGFNDLVPNSKGFDDVAAANGWNAPQGALLVPPQGWSLPAVPSYPGTFASMNLDQRARSLINCENCHGPGELHWKNNFVNPGLGANIDPPKPMDAAICSGCHSNGRNHVVYELWQSTGHSNLEVAINESGSTSCQRCHVGQGFLVYAADLAAGNPNSLATNIATLLGTNNVQPITCQTCHDPHTLEVRFDQAIGDPAMLLPGGFSISNAGAGALCATCHNSRNGNTALAPATGAGPAGSWQQHNDAVGLSEAVWGTRTLTGPHEAAQADVYFAGNGYLLGAAAPAQPNYHSEANFFGDTCVACHVARFPDKSNNPIGGGLQPFNAITNHTFLADATTCIDCHGVGLEFSSQTAAFQAGIQAYLVKAAQVLNAASITTVTNALEAAAGALSKPVASSTVTVTLPNHGWVTGDTVKVSFNSSLDTDVAPVAAGAFKAVSTATAITVVDANTFTYNDGLVNPSANTTNQGTAYFTNATTGKLTRTITGLTIASFDKSASARPMTIRLALSDGTVVISGANDVANALGPVLYTGTTSKTYGKFMEAVYNYWLMSNDKSQGIHNIPFTKAMLASMQTNLSVP